MASDIRWSAASGTGSEYEREERDLWCRVMAASIGAMNGNLDICRIDIAALANDADAAVEQFRQRFAPREG